MSPQDKTYWNRIVNNKIGELYDRMRQTGIPELGKHVGDFMLYDTLLAGCASRAAGGRPVSASEVPGPDDETVRCVTEFRAKPELVESERLFLAYVDLLDALRTELLRLGV